MTSWTPMGVQPRQPQRALSSSSLSSAQHPPPQPRTLSQQFTPSSPMRRDAPDTATDASDGTQARQGGNSTPRKGGSRLRLEITNDASEAAMLAQSPSSLSSSRILPLGDSLDGANSPALSRASHQEIDNPPMPMPRRRPRPEVMANLPAREPTPANSTGKKDGRPKPYAVEVPTAAPRLTSTNRHENVSGDFFGKSLFSGNADFFPWQGKHLEDTWTTESITKGIFEKHSTTENSSARPNIFPALKQKSGISALSTIFMGVLNQRRHRGQVTSASTFKPPPRVTLTDTKREVWLKDLANPAISLRRLSRTIPHGIRGRTLLDQCLNKNVPTERAVWLAKCVGANEIRAFKRKGVSGAFVMGGEAKWSRDWTVFVEQFVDTTVFATHEEGWKVKVKYALQLATSLYSDHLLDRDHYLDWIISGLESSPHSRLPMWILLGKIYWRDILCMRKHGRRLISALLSHLHTIHSDPDRDVLIQLSSQISLLLRALLKDNLESFISPAQWPEYRETLKAYLPMDDETCQRAYDAAHIRNSRLIVAATTSPAGGRQQLVKYLDSTMRTPIDHRFPAMCWSSGDDKMDIAKTVVKWATSAHRPGTARIFVAAKLLKVWHDIYKFECTQAVLDVIQDVSDHDQARKLLVYSLVTELVRHETFVIPRYILWLIARGGYHDLSDIDAETGPCATRLLLELPLHCLSTKWMNERSNLLRRACFSIAAEENDISNAIKCVQQTLGLALPFDDPLFNRKPMSLKKLSKLINNSSKALRSSIGAYLKDLVTRQVTTNEERMSLAMFTSVRFILESIEDFSMLSIATSACLKTSELDLLAACADTVNANLHTFSAIGSAAICFQALLERLQSLSQQDGMFSRPYLASMTSLASRMPGQEKMSAHLRQELLKMDRSGALDACSPVSDNMISQTRESEVSEEIEKLLSSGNRIDHPTMNRLFRTIVPRLEAGWKKADESSRVYASLLTKTRVFDTDHFDKLMSDWISHVRTLKQRSPLSELLPLLVNAGCLTMSMILHTANASPPTTMNATEPGVIGSATYLQELLQLLLVKLSKTANLNAEELYKFSVHQQTALWDHSKAFLSLIRNAILEYSGLRQAGRQESPLDGPGLQGAVLDALKLLVVLDSAAVSEAINVKTLPSEASRLVYTMTSKLLQPEAVETQRTSFDKILGLANELTLPFCQLKLNLDLSTTQTTQVTSDDAEPSRLELFANAMDRAIEDNNIMWTHMLPCLSNDISQHLKSLAYERFLNLVPSLKSANLDATSLRDQSHLAQNLIGVIDAITSGQPPPKTAPLNNTLVEKLSDLWEIIVLRDETKFELQEAVRKYWLPSVLRLVVLYSVASEVQTSIPTSAVATKFPPLPNHEARARIILVLCSLLLELDRISAPESRTLSAQVYDVAILLADGLPDDLRVQCAKTILLLPGSTASASTSSDPRLYYVLSTLQPTPAENLVLSHRDRTAMLQTTGPRGMGAMYGIGPPVAERFTPFLLRRWELLSEPTPNVGENDTALSLSLFEAIKI